MVSRQPIVDRNLAVAAYELLFHASRLTDHFAELDDTTAATRLITDAVLTLGIEQITDGHPAIIAVSEALLLGAEVEALPPSVTVALPQAVQPASDVLAACAHLKDRGHRLVLLDYAGGPRRAFLPLVDAAMIDLGAVQPASRRSLVSMLAAQDVQVIARGVETRADYEAAAAAGATYFQGYFFARPSLVSGSEIASSKLSALHLLKAAHRPTLDLDELEQLILSDPALAWKFLAYLNSVEFSWRQRIESVRHGLVMLGERATRTWVSLVTVSSLVGPTAPELSRLAITRGRFCELLGAAAEVDATSLELFMTGTFSLVDGLLDRPLPVAVAQVPLSAAAKAAILGELNAPGRILRAVTAYERGHWDQLFAIAEQLGVDGGEVNRCYLEAVEWTDALLEDRSEQDSQPARV